jgi:uncharacterized protein YjbI with pentapeptide repeats
MAKKEHLVKLAEAMEKQDIEIWNRWRRWHPDVKLDLSKVNLDGSDLSGAKFNEADLSESKFNRVRSKYSSDDQILGTPRFKSSKQTDCQSVIHS